MRYLILLLLAVCPMPATVWTLCASGCDFTTPQAAYDGAACGDTIIVSVETFTGATSDALLLAAWKSDNCARITFVSRQAALLPPRGVRVTSAHSGLMPKWRQGVSGTIPIIELGQYARTIDAVDTSANTITLNTATGLANGVPISCNTDNNYGSGGALPGGIVANTVYFVGSLSSATFQLLDQVGGSAVDITSSGSGQKRCTPVRVAGNISLIGIQFETNGLVMENEMIKIGTGEESSVRGMVSGMIFDHCRVVGLDTLNGPRNGIVLNANNSQVLDSEISSVKYAGSESHAIWGGSQSWGIRIINTALNAASMSFFTGGATYQTIADRLVSNVYLANNYLYKSGFMLYQQGAGAPAGACFPGRFYRDTTPSPNTCANSACYTCEGSGYEGTWALDTGATYWSGTFVTKAITELKTCNNCTFEGNFFANGFDDGDTGNPGAAWYASQVDVGFKLWSTIQNTVFRNNRADNVWRGTAVGVTESTAFTVPINNITIHNNLVENMANYPAMSIWSPSSSSAQSYSVRSDGGFKSVKITNNTMRTYPTTGLQSFSFLGVGAGSSKGQMVDFAYQGNNVPQGASGIFLDGSNGTCGASGIQLYMDTSGGAPYPMYGMLEDGSSAVGYGSCTTNHTNVNPIPYVSASDSRLDPGSPYSADCAAGCAFTAPNGADMGADIDAVVSATSGAVAGTRPWLSDLRIIPGSTRTLFTYTAPDDDVCALTLYDGLARIAANLNPDTNAFPERSDDRAGNITNGRSRQFVLGTNSALTAGTEYWYKLSCASGAQYRVGSFRTSAVASAGRNYTFQYATARTGQYSSNADMSSPTSISSSATHTVPVGQGAIVYYRQTGGPIQVLVAN